MGEFAARKTSGRDRAWLRPVQALISATAMAGVIAGIVVLGQATSVGAGRANRQRGATELRRNAAHAIDPAMVACERRKSVCNPAALNRLPLIRPVPAGAALLSRTQVLSRFHHPGTMVVVARTTYGAIHRKNPALAASAVVYPGRIVWIVMEYFPRPVTVDGGNGPVGAPSTVTITAESFVVDAATGDVTDYCLGCAVVPKPRSSQP